MKSYYLIFILNVFFINIFSADSNTVTDLMPTTEIEANKLFAEAYQIRMKEGCNEPYFKKLEEAFSIAGQGTKRFFRKKLESLLTSIAVIEDFQKLEFFLKNGFNPNVQDEIGFSPLGIAVTLDFFRSAELLLDFDADIDTKDRFGFTPIMRSLQCKHNEIFKMLLYRNADLKNVERFLFNGSENKVAKKIYKRFLKRKEKLAIAAQMSDEKTIFDILERFPHLINLKMSESITDIVIRNRNLPLLRKLFEDTRIKIKPNLIGDKWMYIELLKHNQVHSDPQKEKDYKEIADFLEYQWKAKVAGKI